MEDDDWEDFSCARSEIDSDDLLGEKTRPEMDIVIVPADQPLDPLPDGIVFFRAGEQVPEAYPGALPHPRATAHLIPHAAPYQDE